MSWTWLQPDSGNCHSMDFPIYSSMVIEFYYLNTLKAMSYPIDVAIVVLLMQELKTRGYLVRRP
ncbi:MAG: hypothetical protein JWR09_2049 [Mucilaginibacter sp.]|nr:hypothetical protein [Mucilaginibacter sp.]